MLKIKANTPAHVFDLAKLHIQIINGEFSREAFGLVTVCS